ncbi:MAG: hypothetical protein SP4CHLAM5_10870 [Chlamydiia bacterium]|nr:hypothetical protein [Chlamydiia bacterium]MCH9618944.1 hypothetical protein [Chlamydiia bacterium]MCH9624714.1 hypothetical protein [Chlamydiia bacterium]
MQSSLPMLLRIKVKANTSQSKIHKMEGNYLVVYTKAPREKGLANKELIGIISENFNISKSAITIQSGSTSVTKMIHIEDAYASLVFERLSMFS